MTAGALAEELLEEGISGMNWPDPVAHKQGGWDTRNGTSKAFDPALRNLGGQEISFGAISTRVSNLFRKIRTVVGDRMEIMLEGHGSGLPAAKLDAGVEESRRTGSRT
ncbi:MAG: hypothetical protein R2845_08185 [Thermomicrobiales bacterium]